MVGLLSIIPTIQIIRWRRCLTADAAFLPAVSDVAGVRLYLWAEVAFFAFIPAFAAAMAQGYGPVTARCRHVIRSSDAWVECLNLFDFSDKRCNGKALIRSAAYGYAR
jgi:Predicted membrane protein (DUF2214)